MAWRSSGEGDNLNTRNRTDSDSDDLSAFSLADALSQVRSSRQAPPQPQPQPRPRQIFSFYGAPPRIDSHQSIDTTASFATANESVPPATPASQFADPEPEPEETTMPSKSKNGAKGASAPAAPAKPAPKPAPKAALPVVIAEKAPAPAPAPMPTPVAPMAEDEAHFDVAQTAYGAAKDAWAWWRTVPLVTNLLGIAEAVASKVVDATVHMDLPAIDQQAVTPQLKKLDDGVVTPAILAVWKIVGPAFARGEEMVVRPVLTEVVPRVLMPLGMFGGDGGKKIKEEKEAMIDAGPTPEVVPAM